MSNVSWTTVLPPISEQWLIYYVTHCHKILRSRLSTIKLYICGVRFQYISAGLPSPFDIHTNNLVRLQMVLKGIKRVESTHSSVRYPITFSVLSAMCTKLRQGFFNANIDIMMETVCTVAFFGFLRCGEFTCFNCHSFDPDVNLCVGDVGFEQDHAVLTLKRSKTDPFRHGVAIKLFCNSSSVCPSCSLRRYVRHRFQCSAVPSDALFIMDNSQPLTRQIFIMFMRRILQACGFRHELYHGHSFRIGAATTAAACGVADHLIKTLGRWSSDSYCRYIRTAQSTLHQAQQALIKPTI